MHAPARAACLFAASVLLSLISARAAAAQTVRRASVLQTGGSVPVGAATNEVMHLTFRDAIDMALRYNLEAIESTEAARAARAQRMQALSILLPNVSVGASYDRTRISAASIGLSSAPGFSIPAAIGPFAYSTIAVTASQAVVNVEATRRLRAAQSTEHGASLSRNDALDLVTLTVGNAYLQVIAAGSRIEATEAEVRNAQALSDRAADAFEAGTSPRIDVTRTAVQLHTEQFNLTVARNTLAIVKLNLARAIGLPLGQAFDLADRLPYADVDPLSVDGALKTAFESRADFRAAELAVESAQQEIAAARAQRFPTLSVSGDYGRQGVTVANTEHIFSFLATATVPVFTGGRITSQEAKGDAALQQRRAERDDLRGQIDYDVRTALLNLQAAKQQVAVARENVELANENLERSQERFAAGVTDSVEVVQAQQSLSHANDQLISGAYSHNLAKLQFARAIGAAHTGYAQYLGKQP
jgi:outer membrane protein TolC